MKVSIAFNVNFEQLAFNLIRKVLFVEQDFQLNLRDYVIVLDTFQLQRRRLKYRKILVKKVRYKK